MSNRLLPSLSRSMILIALGAIFGFLAVSSSPAIAATASGTLPFDHTPIPIVARAAAAETPLYPLTG